MQRRLILGLAVVLLGMGVYLVLQVRKPPRHAPDPTAPLTDVAGPAPSVAVSPDEMPARRLARLRAAAPAKTASQLAPKTVMPAQMPDVAHPPQWTDPRAMPAAPVPPDPTVPPPMAVDPRRGHTPNVE